MNKLLILVTVAVVLIVSVWFFRSRQSQQEQTILTRINLSISDTGRLNAYTCIPEDTLKKIINDYNTLNSQITTASQSILSNKNVIDQLILLSTQYKNTIDTVSILPLCNSTCIGGEYRDDTCICPNGTYQKLENNHIFCSKNCIVSSTGTLLKECSATCGTGLQTWIKNVYQKEENGGTCLSEEERTYLTTCMLTSCQTDWCAYNTTSSTITEYTTSICTDAENNIYTVSGYSDATLNVYDSKDILFDTLQNNSYIIKYTESGDVVWTARLEGISYSITSDTTNSIYVTGKYSSSLNVYNKDGSIFKTLPNNGSGSVFIIKYSSVGNVVWATYLSGNSEQSSYSIVCDLENNVYIAGDYTSIPLTIYSVDASTTTLVNSGGNDGFIVKLNKDGNTVWTTRIAGGLYQSSSSVCVDIFGNVYVTGQYQPTTSADTVIYNSDGSIFGTLPITINVGSNSNSFVVKYDKYGKGILSTYLSSNNYVYTDIIYVRDGYVYITGEYYFMLTLYNRNGTIFKTLVNEGDNDCFVAKYDLDLNGVWATHIGGDMYDTGYSVVTDYNQNVYISGSFNSDRVTIYNQDGTPFKSLMKQGTDTNSFIVKYSGEGRCLSYYQFGGNSSHVWSMAIDSMNNLCVVGDYNSPTPLTVYGTGENVIKTLPATSSAMNSFIVKYVTV